MIIYPAIDLKDNQAVRLLRGNMKDATVFDHEPAEHARTFTESGCEWLHLVDLNGAFEGKPVNTAAVKAILNTVDVPTQLGGGIRNMQTIDYWIECGITRVILGTAAVEDPNLVRTAARAHPDKIAIGLDVRNGHIATRGWAEETNLGAFDIARQFEDAGVCAVIFTDISRDGAMQGPNVHATAQLATSISVPVIASGGVSTREDLLALRDTRVISGVVIGRALYDKTIDLHDAIRQLAP